MSPVKAYDPPIELRMNELGLRFLYKLRSDTTYTESLNTWMTECIKTMKKTKKQPDQQEYLRKREQKNMKEQREIEDNPLAHKLI